MKLLWTPEARQDRRDIYSYIDAENPAAAIRMDEAIAEAGQRLSRRPYIGRSGRVAETREWVIHPNYIIIYDIAGQAIHILRILRILHAAQRWPAPER